MQSDHDVLAWSAECAGEGAFSAGVRIIPAGDSKVESGDRKLGGVERTGGSTGEGEIVCMRLSLREAGVCATRG